MQFIAFYNGLHGAIPQRTERLVHLRVPLGLPLVLGPCKLTKHKLAATVLIQRLVYCPITRLNASLRFRAPSNFSL